MQGIQGPLENIGRWVIFGAALDRLVGGVEVAVEVSSEAGRNKRVIFEPCDGAVVGLPRKHANTPSERQCGRPNWRSATRFPVWRTWRTRTQEDGAPE